MSYGKVQEPQLVSQDALFGDTYQHPAFGQIRINRVQGGSYLYGSEFEHHQYVTLTIQSSKLRRSLSKDWYSAENELIEVAMSEAQWATFVSSFGIGEGVPCTLKHIACEPISSLPAPKKIEEKFSNEIKKTFSEIQEQLRAVSQSLEAGAIGKTKAKELQQQLNLIAERITGSSGFVTNQFDKHMENTIEKAKAEVNAYAVRHLPQNHQSALTNGEGTDRIKQVISLEHHHEDAK